MLIDNTSLTPVILYNVKISFIYLFMPKSDKNCCQKILKQNMNRLEFDTLTKKQTAQISTEL